MLQLLPLATQLETHFSPELHASLQHCEAALHDTPLRLHIVEQGVHASPQLLRHVVVLQVVATHPASAPLLDPLELPWPDPLELEPVPLLEPELLPLEPPELLPVLDPLDPVELPLPDPLLGPELPLDPLDPSPPLDPLLALAPLLLDPLLPAPLLDPPVVESALASSEAESPRVASKPELLPPSSAESSPLPSSLAIASSPGVLSSPPLDAPDDPDDPEDALLPLLLAVPLDVPFGPSVARASTRVGSSMPRMVPQPHALPASVVSASANARRPLCRRTGRTIHSSTIDRNT